MKGTLERRLAELQRLRSAGGRAELGAFSLEGTRLVERALRAGVKLEAVVCSEAFHTSTVEREASLIAELSSLHHTELHVAPNPQLKQEIDGRSFGDILAIAQRAGGLTLEDALRSVPDGFRPGLLVVFDATDPGNVGALVRTALASGACAFVGVGATDPYHPKAVRTSMGSLFRLPVLHYTTTQGLLQALASVQARLCGAVARGGQSLERAIESSRPMALCVGSEAFGLDEEVLARLDQRLSVPMPTGVDSLSINAAAAVCLYELLGRR